MKRWHWRRVRQITWGNRAVLWGLGGAFVAIWVITTVEAQLTPVLESMATARVNYVVSQVLNGAVLDQIEGNDLRYSDVITIEKDESGQICALTSDMVRLNQLRTNLSEVAVGEVAQLDTGALAIPVGNLTGINLFSGRGIEVPIEVVCMGTSQATFQNRFTEAGINQTQHQILLNLEVDVDILLPGKTLYTSVGVQVPVAETIIVGGVPDTYLQMDKSMLYQ